MDKYQDFYTGSEYAENNPTWDIEDTNWKAKKILDIIQSVDAAPKSICEIGCGSGGILASLRDAYPDIQLTGYDIAPSAANFWGQWDGLDLNLKTGNFLTEDSNQYDILMLIDVLEHLADPHAFLKAITGRSQYLIIHFPLDLSAISVFRESPLLHVRRKVGHIHYFTKNLAFELLRESGYKILDYRYTQAYKSAPQRSQVSKLFGFLREALYWFSKDVGVRLLGGETLMVITETPKKQSTTDNQRNPAFSGKTASYGSSHTD
ncbi:MAG: class I SAM-dependent methyltransferase [Candidatus Thiodiazotropha sp. (ex Notomyrtea botanica)]|nr:class I SAM-dependent methyltransferase [Candidatus Thiodiazotropha sp. (ex Notomyrtea botanica)]